MIEIQIGITDYSDLVFIPDPASTVGKGKTGLVAANLTVSYTRMETDNDAVIVDVTSSLNNLAALTTAHTDWGLIEISATLAPGLYRLDPADAVFASGAWQAVISVAITSGLSANSSKQYTLRPYNPNDGVRLGLTALPNAAADAAGGLPISDAGGLDLDSKLANTNEVTAARMGALTDWINGGRLDLILDAILEDTATTLPATLATMDGKIDTIDNLIDTEIGAIITTLSTIQGLIDTEVAAILADTNELQTDWANGGRLDLLVDAIKAVTDAIPEGGALTTLLANIAAILADTGTDGVVIATASKTGMRLSATGVGDILTTALTESYAADGAAPTASQALFAIQQMMQERAIVTTTMTVKKLDGTTAAMTFTLDDATSPTSITRAT